MISVGEAFKNKINKGIAKIVNYADITLSDGTVLELTPSDILVGGCTITDKSTTGSKFMIGTANAKTLTLQIANHNDKFSKYNFYNSTVFVYIKDAEDETEEVIRKGKFYITEPETKGDVIKITGSDSMILLDRDYDTTLTYPTTLGRIASDICTLCGVGAGFTTFDNSNFEVSTKPTDCTCRDVIRWVAQISGSIARFNHNDYLVFENYTVPEDVYIYFGGRYMTENDTIINGGNFTSYETDLVIKGGDFSTYSDKDSISNVTSMTISTDDVVITGAKVIYEKEEVLKGTDDYALEIKANPLTIGKLEAVANYINTKYNGFSFRPMSVSIIENPLLEPFDGGYVSDYKGNTYLAIINNVTYKVNGGTTIKCEAQSPTRNNTKYISASAQAIAKARSDAEQNLTQYDLAVQRMNLLAANSMGFYSTEEILDDDSRIWYMHSSPELENSEVIYKMTADGFFVSSDGGETYTAGFDAEGNAVLNILSAVGIRFNWAKGGELTLGGEDDVNGRLIMLNSVGAVYGYWDNSSLSIGGNFVATANQVSIGGNFVATANQVSIGGTYGMVATSSDITIGGSMGMVASSSGIKLGGYGGVSITSSGVTIGTQMSITSSSVTIGGTYGISIDSSSVSIGGSLNGVNVTSSGVTIGGINGVSVKSNSVTVGNSAFGITIGSSSISIGSYMTISSSSITIGSSGYGSSVTIKSSGVEIGGSLKVTSTGISIGSLYSEGMKLSGTELTFSGYNGTSIKSDQIYTATFNCKTFKINSTSYSSDKYYMLSDKIETVEGFTSASYLYSSNYYNYIFSSQPSVSSYKDADGKTFYAFSSSPSISSISKNTGHLLKSAPSTSEKYVLHS